MNSACAKKPEAADEYLAELEMHQALKRYAEAKVNGIGCAKPETPEQRRRLEEARNGIEKRMKKRVLFEGERERHQRRLNTMERAMWYAKKHTAERKRKNPLRDHPNKPRGLKVVDRTLENFRYMQKACMDPAKGASLVGVAYQVFQMP